MIFPPRSFCPGPNGSNFPNSRRYHRPAGAASGQRKTNYLLALTGKDNQNLYAAVLIQTDMDSVSYKICNLLPQTTAEGSTLAGVYNSGGINSLVQMTETATGIKPDFTL